jgi:toxin YoeB
MTYKIIFIKEAQKDFQKIKKSHHKKTCLTLIDLIKTDPFKNPPPYKKLLGYSNMYSRRINIQHRLLYELDEKNKMIKILKLWNHYYDN